MTLQNNRLALSLLAVPLLLLVPLLAMEFTQEVNWGPADFLVMGALLTCVILAIEFVLRKVTSKKHRILLSSIVVIGFLLLWAELAVGWLGTPFAGS